MTTEDENQPVTVVINQLVKPGCEEAYEDLLRQIFRTCATYPGHQGTNIIRPQPGGDPHYVIVFKFDSYKNLTRWMESRDRSYFLEQFKPLIHSPPKIEQISGLEAWFSVPGQPLKTPPRYKTALLTWAAVFILINLLNTFLMPLLRGLPPIIATFILTVLMVLLLTYVVMPQVMRWFKRWLYPNSKSS